MSKGAVPSRTWILTRFFSWLRQLFSDVEPVDSRRHSWARLLHSMEEVPEPYRAFFDRLPPAELHPFPHAAVTPTFKGISRKAEREKLVVLTSRSLNILTAEEGGLSLIEYPLNSGCCVEFGSILLNAWITIHGMAGDGEFHSTSLRFNTVSESLMLPFAERLRSSAPASLASVAAAPQDDPLGFLARVYYKFYSRGRSALRPGKAVQQILFQPEVRSGAVRLFGHSISWRLSPAHLTILTDLELIHIRDDDSQFWLRGAPHGAITSFIPRRAIIGASLEREHGLPVLSLVMQGDLSKRALFEMEREQELGQLISRLMP